MLASWSTLKWVNWVVFLVQFYAAQQPGRLDGSPSQQSNENQQKLAQSLKQRRSASLLNPAGWTFAIWAPIFLGEFLSTTAALMLVHEDDGSDDSSLLLPKAGVLLQRASAGFVTAQLFQTLWAASFRPRYYENNKKWSPWISSLHLTGIAVALSRAHAAYSSTASEGGGGVVVGTGAYLLYLLPMTLHFAWSTAAALVSWNANFAVLCLDDMRHPATAVAAVGVGSTLLAVAVSVVVTVSRRAPVFGGVLAWALAGCASGMQQRLRQREDAVRAVQQQPWYKLPRVPATVIQQTRQRPGFYGAAVQKWCCTIGAVISGAVAVWTAVHRPSKGVAP